MDGIRTMTKQEIEETVESFRKAAGQCQMAGADSVQIPAGHGFLLLRFLSPITNHRTDLYWGNIDNRSKVLYEIVHQIRSECSPSLLITAKINSSDVAPGGLTPEDTALIIKNSPGFDLVEVSCSMNKVSMFTKPFKRLSKSLDQNMKEFLTNFYQSVNPTHLFKPMYNWPAARIIKADNPNANVAHVGGISRTSEIETSSQVEMLT